MFCVLFACISEPETFEAWCKLHAEEAQERHDRQLQRWRTLRTQRDAWWRMQEGGLRQLEETAEAKFPAVGTPPVEELSLTELAKELGEPECYLE